MNKLWLGTALITLTLSAFVRTINSQTAMASENATEILQTSDEDQSEEAAISVRPLSGPTWFCVAVDSFGHRFTGSSFVASQARTHALMLCERSPQEPRIRTCRIESCAKQISSQDRSALAVD